MLIPDSEGTLQERLAQLATTLAGRPDLVRPKAEIEYSVQIALQPPGEDGQPSRSG